LHLTAKDSAYLATKAPHISFSVARGAESHPHPLLNLDREIAEQVAYDYLCDLMRKGGQSPTAWIVDIGGNASRHARNRRTNIHSCCPLLDAADVIRNLHHRHQELRCTHRVSDCDCVAPGAFLSIDSLYYLGPEEIFALVDKSSSKLLVAAFHEFPDAYGSFASGEATYQVTGVDSVAMTVRGNSHTYVHSRMAWLRAGSHRVGDRSLCWTKLKDTTDHAIYTFTVHDGVFAVPQDPAPLLHASLGDESYFGQVLGGPLGDAKASVSGPGDFITSPSTSLYSLGPWLLVFRRDSQVTMFAPKSLVSDATQYMMGRPRTPDTFSVLLAYVRHAARRINLPSALLANSVFVACCLAFTASIQFEIEAMHGIVQPTAHLLPTHDDALKLRFRHVWRSPAVVAKAVAAATLVSAGLASLICAPSFAASVAAVAAVATAAKKLGARPAVADVTAAVRNAIIRNAATPTVARVYDVYRAYVEGRCTYDGPSRVIHVPAQRLPSTAPSTAEDVLRAMPIDPTATVVPAEHRPARLTNDILVAGVVSTYNTPIIAENSPHSELSAVIERGLKMQPYSGPNYKPKAFAAFRQWVFKNFDVLFPGITVQPVRATPFETWNARFPGNVQRTQKQAHEELKTRSFREWSMHIRKTFVKVECQNKATRDGVSDFAPRMIQGATTHHNVFTGPWIHAFSKRLATMWPHDAPLGLGYATATSGDALGAAFSATCDAIPQHVVADGDFSKLDSTLHREFIELEVAIFKRAGAPPDIIEYLLGNVYTTGYCRYGTMYSVDGTRRSGDHQTSCGNTMLTSIALLYVMCAHNGLSVADALLRLRLFALGDDSYMVANFSLFLGLDLKASLLSLGLNFKPRVHVGPDCAHHATFLASRFYPVDRVLEDGTRVACVVLAPCIGRVVGKIGYYANAPKRASPLALVRSDALGRHRDLAPVPFLRCLVGTMLRLTRGTSMSASPALHDHKVHLGHVYQPNEATYRMVQAVYGLTRDQEGEYAAMLDATHSLPVVVDYAPLSNAARVDGTLEDGVDYAGGEDEVYVFHGQSSCPEVPRLDLSLVPSPEGKYDDAECLTPTVRDERGSNVNARSRARARRK
jgi:hypothetical protein